MFKNLTGDAKLFIFDLDGVIADLDVNWMEALQTLRTTFGRETESIRGIFDSLGGEERKRAVKIMEGYELAHIDYARIHQSTVNFIKNIPENVPLAIFSTNTNAAIEFVLEKAGIKGKFKFIVSVENVKKLKPDPEGLNSIIQAAKVERELAVFFGDRDIDLEAGAKAGIRTELVGE